MVLEEQPIPFFQWLISGGEGLPGALLTFAIIIAVLALLALAIGFGTSLIRFGPHKAGDLTYRTVVKGGSELFYLSPRRVWALARLAMKESWHLKVGVAFVLFIVILFFKAWFSDLDNREPTRNLFSFVLDWTTYLLLLIALLLSCFSLPRDIKSKTIFTVVTKPVRSGEIILGRILGFTLVGTALLIVMSICSYVFVVRSVVHTHRIEPASLQEVPDKSSIYQQGRTTYNDELHHRHTVTRGKEGGPWRIEDSFGHFHEVQPDDGDPRDATLTGPLGHLQARVPLYGTLRYLDRSGGETDRGISVGNEWTYRSFIDGGTAARAIWTFSDVDSLIDPNGKTLPIVLNVRVFRSHKGDIERGVQGRIHLRNPETGERSQEQVFFAKDDSLDDRSFNRELRNEDGEEIDLFDDLVSDDGKIEVWVACVETGHYYGFAQADCYLELPSASPLVNFCKAHVSIWVQMVIVIAFGVAASSLVSGPVAVLYTVSIVVLGLFKETFVKIAFGENYGGGPVESLYRLVTQMNVISPLEEGIGTSIIKSSDFIITGAMKAVAQVFPDFTRLDKASYVAEGYNIPMGQTLQDVVICLAYVLGLYVVGYFLLRTREIAK